MKTFEISYTYNYRAEVCKIFKAVDGLDALDALENWVLEKTNSIRAVKLQEIHLGHFSKEGRVSHSYGDIILNWKIKNSTTIEKTIQNSKQNWIDQLNKKYDEK